MELMSGARTRLVPLHLPFRDAQVFGCSALRGRSPLSGIGFQTY